MRLTNTVSTRRLSSNCNGLFFKSRNFCERLREDSVATAEQRLPNWKHKLIFTLIQQGSSCTISPPDKVTGPVVVVPTLLTASCREQNPLRESITVRSSRESHGALETWRSQVSATVGICAGPAVPKPGLAGKYTRIRPLGYALSTPQRREVTAMVYPAEASQWGLI